MEAKRHIPFNVRYVGPDCCQLSRTVFKYFTGVPSGYDPKGRAMTVKPDRAAKEFVGSKASGQGCIASEL